MTAVGIAGALALAGILGFAVAAVAVRRTRSEGATLVAIFLGGLAGWLAIIATAATLVALLFVWMVQP